MQRLRRSNHTLYVRMMTAAGQYYGGKTPGAAPEATQTPVALNPE
jgi:hypothetical protein